MELFGYDNLVYLFWLTFMTLLWLWLYIFCKAHFGEVLNFMAVFALVLLCQAVESLCMWGVTTSSTLVWISIVWLLLVWLHLLLWLLWLGPFNWVWFLTAFFLLDWQASVVVSQYMYLSMTLHVWCMLVMCVAVALLDSRFLVICHTFEAGYCTRSVFPSSIVLAIDLVSDMENQMISLVRIVIVSVGYPHNGMCAWTALYHSLILLLPCLKDVNRSNHACTAFDCGLQNSSHFDYMVCNVTSAVKRAHEMYIPSPMSVNHWITFSHLALSWSIESLQSIMFSHFIFHHANLEWRASFMVQSILGSPT